MSESHRAVHYCSPVDSVPIVETGHLRVVHLPGHTREVPVGAVDMETFQVLASYGRHSERP